MSYEQSSSASSFYENSITGNQYAGNGFGVSYGQSAQNLGQDNYSSFESSSVSSGAAVGDEASILNAAGLHGFQMAGNSFEQQAFGGGGAAAVAGSAGVAADSSSFEQTSSSSSFSEGFGGVGVGVGAGATSATSATVYATDAQGLFKDPNPQVIRRAATSGPQTYTQKIVVRFLQPPPVPPPGPLIIKEVRPPQPPPPPPLYIRQRPPPPPTLPPLVIREAPPKPPPVVGTQVITKTLPPLPVPPRSVIIERLPPLPPKPHDVIVERWLPYRTTEKRKVIVQRAPPPAIPTPRNIIIYYEPPKAQVVRRFENLGVQRANPTEYVARYGTQLSDSQTLLAHARQAGVTEDISIPAGGAAAASYQSFGTEFGGAATGFQSSNFESFQSTGAEFGAGSASTSAGAAFEGVTGTTLDLNSDAALNIARTAGFDVSADASTSGNYQSYSSYSSSSGVAGASAEGLDTSFDNLGFANGAAGNSSYSSYSSQETYAEQN